MNFCNISAVVLAATLTVGAASAATVTSQYNVTSAIGTQGSNVPGANNNADHSVWISVGVGAYGKDFDFDPAGLMTFLDDTTAALTGRVVSQANSNGWFDLSFNYDENYSLTPTFKSENGSIENGAIYKNLAGGTLTGGGDLAGLNLSVTRMPIDTHFATQIGEGTGSGLTATNGANNKNNNFGMANWFFIKVEDSTAQCGFCTNNIGTLRSLQGAQGDVNVDLSAVPLPAAGLLLFGALGALGAVHRRKRKTA